MNPKHKKILSLVLLVVFLVSTGLLARNILNFGSGGDTYSDAADLARSGKKQESTAKTQPEAPQTEPTQAAEPVTVWVPAPLEEADPNIALLEETDLSALREVNEDVIGWIQIPDTKIDYPLVQGEDNEHYLKHTWKGYKNVMGSVFMECKNNPDMSDYHTILYAHNMSNGAMFGSLHRYQYEKYWQEHPYVYVVTENGVLRYEVFSTYTTDVESKTYGLSFRQAKTREEFVNMALENSQLDMGIEPAITDNILTLSTCSVGRDTRRVVHARLPMVAVTLE